MAELQRVLSCVTRAVLIVSPGGYQQADFTRFVASSGRTAPLSAITPVSLYIKHGYSIIGAGNRAWSVATTVYHYVLEDAESREILAYHWHPHTSTVGFPHLHLGAGAGVGRPEMLAAHLPTGEVALRDDVRLPIRDFGVAPLRADWAVVLDAGA